MFMIRRQQEESIDDILLHYPFSKTSVIFGGVSNTQAVSNVAVNI